MSQPHFPLCLPRRVNNTVHTRDMRHLAQYRFSPTSYFYLRYTQRQYHPAHDKNGEVYRVRYKIRTCSPVVVRRDKSLPVLHIDRDVAYIFAVRREWLNSTFPILIFSIYRSPQGIRYDGTCTAGTSPPLYSTARSSYRWFGTEGKCPAGTRFQPELEKTWTDTQGCQQPAG